MRYDPGHGQRTESEAKRQAHLYNPDKWRLRTSSSASRPDVRAHWRGMVPDPTVTRRTVSGPGDVAIPHDLLTSGLGDLRILLWARIRSWFFDEEGPTSYVDLATALLGPELTDLKVATIGRLMRPMLGTWILRRRAGERGWVYRTGEPFSTADEWGSIRGEMLDELTQSKVLNSDSLRPHDLVNFARWRMECRGRGWTIESSDRLARSWKTTLADVKASRERLIHLGWLTHVPRRDSEVNCPLIWIAEDYDPQQLMVEINEHHRACAAESGNLLATQHDTQVPAAIDRMLTGRDLAGLRDHLRANVAWHLMTLNFEELNDLMDGWLTDSQLSALDWWESTIASPAWAGATRGRTTEADPAARGALPRARPAASPQFRCAASRPLPTSKARLCGPHCATGNSDDDSTSGAA